MPDTKPETPLTDHEAFDWSAVARGEAPPMPVEVVYAGFARGLEMRAATWEAECRKEQQWRNDAEFECAAALAAKEAADNRVANLEEEADILTQHKNAYAERAEAAERELAALRADAEKDKRRIAFVAQIIDGMGDVDFHEDAAARAQECGREEPDYEDYYTVIAFAIDAALRAEPGAQGG